MISLSCKMFQHWLCDGTVKVGKWRTKLCSCWCHKKPTKKEE